MKNTTKKISAAALALIMGATAFTGCSGGTATSGGTANGADSSAESTTATGSQKIMSSNEDVKSAIDNVSVAEDYKNIKVDTKLKFMAWYDIQEAAPSVELFKSMYGTPKNKPEGYESVADENVFVNVRVQTMQTDMLTLQSLYSQMTRLIHSHLKPLTIPMVFTRTCSSLSMALSIPRQMTGQIIRIL